jgi:hypothetical protein
LYSSQQKHSHSSTKNQVFVPFIHKTNELSLQISWTLVQAAGCSDEEVEQAEMGKRLDLGERLVEGI